MKSFEQIVEHYRKKKIREMISNDSLAHGKVLFDNIFQAAIDDGLDVKIVSGSLSKQFYNGLAHKAQTLLKKNRIDVVLTLPRSGELEDNSFRDIVENSPNGTVHKLPEATDGNHFILAGDRVYRFELDHDRGKATANFNDELVGGRLAEVFAQMKTLAQPLE